MTKYVSPQAVCVKVNGKTFKYESHAEAARANNVKPGTLSLRLKKGWTIKQALGLSTAPKKANVHKKIRVGNTTFRSISDAAKHYGIKSSIVSSRLRKGWTTKQALGIDTQPPRKTPKGKKLTLSVNGNKVIFNSITDAAKHYGISPRLVMQRLATNGWTPKQALGLETPPGGGWLKKIKLKQEERLVTYESLKDAVDAFGIDYDVVKQRINKLGWSPEQALELESPPKHAKGCLGYIYKVTNTKNNKVYIGQTKTTVDIRWKQHIEVAQSKNRPTQGSLQNAIQEYGVNSFNCEVLEAADSIDKLNRLERDYIIEYKARKPAYGYNLSRGGSGLTGGKKVIVQGEQFDSLYSAARSYNVNPKVVHQRININGWTIEQALEIKPPPEGCSGPKRIIVSDKGKKKEFSSNAAAARHYGVAYKLFHSRIRSGWPIEQALGLEKRPERIHKGKSLSIKHKGKLKHYHSVAEAAREFGLPRSRVQARINRGWSLEQALEVK